MKSGSNLERVLAAGQFAVTAECGPPRGADPEKVLKKAEFVKGNVDACNVTDNQTSVVRMSSLAGCLLVRQSGTEPLLQMVVRDRNRIALQSDLLGASALGVRNLLCLSGDHQKFGDDPQAKNVFDIDSIQLIHLVKTMRDDGVFPSGEKLDGAPKFFIGCAVNPFADPFEIRVPRFKLKADAGADFVQTQCIYNMDTFTRYMEEAKKMGLHERVKILAGVTPLKSVGMAKFMNKMVAGIDIPEPVIKRLADEPKEKQAAKGIEMCIEQIQQLKEMEGIAGVHVMAIEWEEKLNEIIGGAGLLPRPVVDEGETER
ncbi:methylenetetrahydrofolate reductase [Desulfofustis glycolicus]|uniref:Methylenetetrahydrofolate reductase n=1 Tax=Desulfofustis glycolicus DSM 9705 TaxID=1121409 RepID=A0A1M5TPC0_9BACT|nr:methylenetetrahydrofolate reductase [Desulfofustis glycolicus]MCB2216521.1 methylenetetrahydrofolate reductase [Desulfobulbaceae bacterium]SHH52530.1 5,10-methylenetetrahydrofolate reductase (ferredoxin) [Desulfofustis glycolicus DSM 9705]